MYGLCAVLYRIAAVLIGLAVQPRVSIASARRPKSLFAGLRFIRRQPAVLGAISLDLFAVLLGGATALLPIFARDMLNTGPWGSASLRSAPAVGALAMAVWLAHHPIQRHAGRNMFAAVAVLRRRDDRVRRCRPPSRSRSPRWSCSAPAT